MMNSTVFTIEQVDLIRRLRRTGIPLDKLVYAYREMDRLERESVQQSVQLSLKNSHNSAFNSFNLSSNHSTNNGNGTSVNNHLNSNNNSNNSNNTNSNANNTNNSVVGNNSSLNLTGSIDQLNMTSESLSSYDQNMSGQFGMSLPSTSKLASTTNFVDEHAELMEFKKKGESAMLMEIRSFVAKYNIRQNMLAEMTGISQGYISRFFRGEGQDISERARNLIYSWYLNFRRNPTKILQCCPMTVGDRKMISESGDLLPIRRDRFIFRKQHLQVLEQYFAENPYPDSHTKEQIAEECNSAAERVSSRPLSDKDKVTTSIVSNWFNNKRKDLKISRHLQGKILLMAAAAQQQQNSDSNSSMMDSQHNSNANNLSQNLSQQVGDNALGNPHQNSQQHSPAQSQQQQQQQAQHENNSNNYYYRDTQPLKLETYPDLPLQCYQTMDEEESDSESF